MDEDVELLSDHVCLLEDESEIRNATFRTRLWSAGALDSSVIWIISAALSLVTTRYLLFHGFHYPLRILSVHLAAALILRLLVWIYKETNRRDLPPLTLESSTHRSTVTADRRCLIFASLLYIICTSGALICGYQAIQHFQTLASLVMLLALDWQPRLIFDDLFRKLGSCAILRQALLTGGIIAIYVFDYGLTSRTIIFSLVSAGCTGAAKFLYPYIVKPAELQHDGQRPIAYRLVEIDTLALLSTTIAVLCCVWRWEYPVYTPVDTGSFWYVWIINVFTTACAFESGGHVFRRLKWQTHTTISSGSGSLDQSALTLSLVGLVSAGDSIIGFPSQVASWQYIGFLVASIAIHASGIIKEVTPVPGRASYYQRLPFTADQPKHTADNPSQGSQYIKDPKTSYIRPAVIMLTLVITWPTLLCLTLNPDLDQWQPVTPVLDVSYPAPRPLDVVVSRYGESVDTLAWQLRSIISLPNVRDLSPNIIIYNKNNATHEPAFISQLSVELGAGINISMRTRPNLGREAVTYLDHIVSEWDDLASHTLFVQAEMHHSWLVQSRIADYFVPQTGFISLSPYGLCEDCDQCGDHSRWSEQGSVLKNIYSRANSGQECRDLVLTYRGQFIASASRIRGVGKALFTDLLHQMTDAESAMHQPAYWDMPWRFGRDDSLGAPIFGYTLERMWGAILQCSDPRLPRLCPSLLSGAVNPLVAGGRAALDDCQCLDR